MNSRSSSILIANFMLFNLPVIDPSHSKDTSVRIHAHVHSSFGIKSIYESFIGVTLPAPLLLIYLELIFVTSPINLTAVLTYVTPLQYIKKNKMEVGSSQRVPRTHGSRGGNARLSSCGIEISLRNFYGYAISSAI